jgi:glycosyltransferase involved in cell wall biosynthesis
MARASKKKVAYILNAFPKLSETFILNEIWELKKRGVGIFVAAVGRSGEKIMHPKAEAFATEVTYLGEMGRRRKLENVMIAGFLHPLRVIQAAVFIRKRYSRGKRWKLQQALYLGGELIRDGINHVHAHFAMEAAEQALLANRATGISYSMHPHALDIYVRPKMLKDKMRHAKFVSTPCEYNRGYLLDFLPEYPERKVVVLRLGIDLDVFAPSENGVCGEDVRNELAILSVSRLVEKKGMIYLLEAVKRLVDNGTRVRARIVGDGPESEHLATYIAENGLESCVDLLGPRTSDDVKELFDASDVFVLPCIVAENGDRDATPTAILEAMAMKIPVISTQVAGIPEIVPADCGFVIPEKDATSLAAVIKRVAEMTDLKRKAMGETGRRFVEAHFNIRVQTDKLVRLFEGP